MQLGSAPISGDHAVYGASVRTDIVPLFDRSYARVLDIGCSTGNTGALLKERSLCDWVTGVELFEETANIARTRLDHVITGSIESALDQIESQSFDCILCLDVLEHLVDPWTVVSALREKLKEGGILICSIPNIRHFSIVFKLLFCGRWNYTDSGILDRTHLRFFTKSSCEDLLNIAGMKLEHIGGEIAPTSKPLSNASLGLLNDLLIGQYLTRSRKVGSARDNAS
ncbi:class I SAM-dependent methyltransferase [Polynucleobacter asymbioticus]|jgi:2-polyprenyl-3-methyl-5-hydroxy-6-metoxy-1,4-benzoquinol methylase|uniref:Class I SAM-dependent methyltransferase n=1 Tax=Polynucleobacter asymbioticus TaxID=576611 RepID=A0AAC9IQE7_9BURK|nr:class I SAM-dependent methyltransferase [Polynucleobacter asymbioticus]APB98150.1 hypothetical protein A4F89_01775 [Polynucleobacter asymbioticus]APC00436.1 hypothetical protein AOC25_01780 [Polynucleobacter asymbioticus]